MSLTRLRTNFNAAIKMNCLNCTKIYSNVKGRHITDHPRENSMTKKCDIKYNHVIKYEILNVLSK